MQALGFVAADRGSRPSSSSTAPTRRCRPSSGRRQAAGAPRGDDRGGGPRPARSRTSRRSSASSAAAAGQPQDAEATPTVDQALFLANGEPIQAGSPRRAADLIGRLAALTDPSAVAEELYLSLLTRRPTAEERAEVAALPRRPRQGPASPPCRSWPGRCWRRPSFGSITDDSPSVASRRRPAASSTTRLADEETPRMQCYLRLRLGRTHASRGGGSSGASRRGSGPGGGLLGLVRSPAVSAELASEAAAGAGDLAGRRRQPARNLGPQAEDRHRRPVPVDRDLACPASGSPSCCRRPPRRCTGWPWSAEHQHQRERSRQGPVPDAHRPAADAGAGVPAPRLGDGRSC